MLIRVQGELISVPLRSAVMNNYVRGEVILDVSRAGHWIRGFEIVGGELDFSLQRAVAPFSPKRPFVPSALESPVVTYDEEADAAFCYLPYGERFRRLDRVAQTTRTEFSHCLTPNAEFSLDSDGGLIEVRFSVVDAVQSVDAFLFLFDYCDAAQ